MFFGDPEKHFFFFSADISLQKLFFCFSECYKVITTLASQGLIYLIGCSTDLWTIVNIFAVQAAISAACLWQDRRVAAQVEVAHKLSLVSMRRKA